MSERRTRVADAALAERALPAMLLAERIAMTALRTGATPERAQVSRLLLDCLAPSPARAPDQARR